MIIEDKLELEKKEVKLLPVIQTLSINENKLPIELNKELSIEILSNDYNEIKENIKDNIEINSTALELILNSLKNVPNNARLGEVLARLLESGAVLHKQFLDLSKQYIDITNMLNLNINTTNNNNINIEKAAIFTGTLKEILHSIPEKPI